MKITNLLFQFILVLILLINNPQEIFDQINRICFLQCSYYYFQFQKILLNYVAIIHLNYLLSFQSNLSFMQVFKFKDMNFDFKMIFALDLIYHIKQSFNLNKQETKI